MAKLEGFVSFRRQPEVIREYLICSTFLFRESFPHLYCRCCAKFNFQSYRRAHDIQQVQIVDPDLCFDLQVGRHHFHSMKPEEE